MTGKNAIKLFENQKIRALWNEDDEDWYFSVIDVVGVLSESKSPSDYWRKLKQRLKEEGNETVTNCHRLKLQAKDGKMRLTDVANTKQLLRIIQSVPSPKAEPFKLWLAEDKVTNKNIANTLPQVEGFKKTHMTDGGIVLVEEIDAVKLKNKYI